MRLPIIAAACLVAAAAFAQAPRIKWRQMDFPVTTKVEVTTDKGQAVLGDIQLFYAWTKDMAMTCTFDNADLSSGLQTLRCHSARPQHKKPFVFDVEYLPEKNTLRFDDADIPHEGRMNKEDVGSLLASIYEGPE